MIRRALFVAALSLLAIANVDTLHAQPAPRARPVAQHYAVLIGVSAYPTGVPSLKGAPLNDLELMRDLLITRLGFAAANIVTLTDRAATRPQVITAIRQHLGQASENDVALFYFSGHGIQVDETVKPAGLNAPERDSLDEALLLWDATAERATYLLDDEVGLLLDELRARRAVAIVDACHSGSATRATLDAEVPWSALGRGPAPARLAGTGDARAVFVPKRVLVNDVRNVIVAPESLLTTRGIPKARTHLLLSAALDGEEALAGPLRLPDGSRKPVGLFTTALYLAVRASTPATTIQEIMIGVRRAVAPVAQRIQGAPQTPAATGGWTGERLQQLFGAAANSRR